MIPGPGSLPSFVLDVRDGEREWEGVKRVDWRGLSFTGV